MNSVEGAGGASPPVKSDEPAGPAAQAAPAAKAAGRTLWGVPAVRLAELVRTGTVSPVEIVRQHLERIDAVEGEVNAFQVLLREEALAAALALEHRDDLAELPLAGVPVAVKDCFDVAGVPTRQGSLASSAELAAEDDPLVARLKAAGAIVIGKTAQPELAIWAHTDTSLHGPTRNPWDPHLTPGGSTGGGGAAVAAGMAPLALGTDGGGSLRIPAAYCGLFGIKPSSDVLGPPGRGASHWHGLTASGPLATSVPDASLMLEVLTGEQRFGNIAAPAAPVRVAVSLRSPLAGFSAARPFGDAVAATAQLLRGAGHEVSEASPPYPLLVGMQWTRNWLAGIAEDIGALPEPAALETATRQMAGIGARLTADAAAPQRWRELMAGFFAEQDVVLMPPVARRLPAVGWTRRGFAGTYLRHARAVPFTQPWNLADLPAVSVPAGLDGDGLPLAVQLVAGRGGEGLLLSLALQLEALRPWPRLAPLRRPVRDSASGQ